jgi:hypothetical protein
VVGIRKSSEARLAEAVVRARLAAAAAPIEGKMRAALLELERLPEGLREPATLLLLEGAEYVKHANNHDTAVERRVALVAGLVFLVVMLAVVLFVPEPSDVQRRTFKLLLALSAAVVAGALSGSVSTTINLPWIAVRATAGIAVFIFIWMLF